ncbi:MAG: hypothetical protein ACK5MN_03460 [Lachnospiraceae bacterium]
MKPIEINIDISADKKGKTELPKIAYTGDKNSIEFEIKAKLQEADFAGTGIATIVYPSGKVAEELTFENGKSSFVLDTSYIKDYGTSDISFNLIDGETEYDCGTWAFWTAVSAKDKFVQEAEPYYYKKLDDIVTEARKKLDDIPPSEELQGKSAYEIWIAEGNTGTITDFLASLSPDIEYRTLNHMLQMRTEGTDWIDIFMMDTGNMGNGAGYKTGAEVTQEINTAMSSALKRQIVSSMSDMTDGNTIYMLLKETAQEYNVYTEYLVIDGVPEKIGDTRMDLTDYYNKSQIDTALSGKMNTSSTITAIEAVDSIPTVQDGTTLYIISGVTT